MTRALGVKCTKDTLDWAVLQGDDRGSATVLDAKRVTAPAGGRGQQLVWVRKEIEELLQKHAVDEVVLRALSRVVRATLYLGPRWKALSRRPWRPRVLSAAVSWPSRCGRRSLPRTVRSSKRR